jgi:two-component system, OmpR family, KDP operon response regulator KdpE
VALILLAEDDEGIRVPLVRALEREGYVVEAFANGRDAIASGVAGEHDLLLLDIGLPGADGLEVCQRVREERPSVPIVFLTVHDGEMDAVGGLDAGADDYITKPFGTDELLARLRAVLRRSAEAGGSPRLELGELTIDLADRRVTRGDEDVHLTPIEFDLVRVLAQHHGRLVTHRQLLQEVWGPEYGEETHYLRVHVAHIRAKLEPDPSRPQYLITEPGVGYRLRDPLS